MRISWSERTGGDDCAEVGTPPNSTAPTTNITAVIRWVIMAGIVDRPASRALQVARVSFGRVATRRLRADHTHRIAWPGRVGLPGIPRYRRRRATPPAEIPPAR